MLDSLSNEPSPDLATAISSIEIDIWSLNRPKKLFLLSKSLIKQKIKEYILNDNILNCSYAAWLVSQCDLSKRIFNNLLDLQETAYKQVISFWTQSILRKQCVTYDWTDIHLLILLYLDYKFYFNNKSFRTSSKIDKLEG